MFTAKMCQAISGNTSYDSCTHRLPNGIPKEKISKVCLKMFSIRFQLYDKNSGISSYYCKISLNIRLHRLQSLLA